MDFTDAVVDSYRGTPDPRLRAIFESLTRHLHAFVRETRPSIAEWESAIRFLTEVGQTCDDTRQEFILLSDVLGVSMLVETVNSSEGATESTVLGPFHGVESPVRALGDSIDLLDGEKQCVVTGRVVNTDGDPIPDAAVDVWQCSEDGFYDVEQPGVQPPGNGRGLFRTDSDGRFRFRTVVPSHYPIPTDGPVGRLLAAAARDTFRPAHIHFIASADGYESVTTHCFVRDSPYLDTDAVFAVKESLIRDFDMSTDAAEAERLGVRTPFSRVEFDISLPTSSGS